MAAKPTRASAQPSTTDPNPTKSATENTGLRAGIPFLDWPLSMEQALAPLNVLTI